MNENSSSNSAQPPNPVAQQEPSAEEMRKQYLNHEASVKSIGTLYFIAAFLIIILAIPVALAEKETLFVVRITGAVSLITFGLFQIWVGTALRALKSWARIPVGVLSGIGLLGFPLGTVVNGYILYLIFCKKGYMVFSPQYHQAIATTPHVKYKTHIIVWILLGIIIVLIALGLFAALVLP